MSSANFKTVVCIDDNAETLFIYSISARNFPVKLITFSDPFEALNHLGITVIPDFILMDINMPATSGFEICQTLRSRSELKEIPVVMLSNSNFSVDIKKALDSGANAYCIKPDDIDGFENLFDAISNNDLKRIDCSCSELSA